jgi:hypothetical protein
MMSARELWNRAELKSDMVRLYRGGEEIKVYPIDVLAKILFEKATQYQILPFLRGVTIRIKMKM